MECGARESTLPREAKRWERGRPTRGGGGGEVLPFMCYIGMCHSERYGFQAVYSGIGYINQRV